MLAEKTPEEELKGFVKTFEQIKKEDLLNMLVETLCLYGDYVQGLGQIHKKYNNVFQATKDFTKTPISPQLVGFLADKATPEMAGIFLKIMLKLNSIAPQMNKLMDLSAKEQIELGEAIKSIAEDFEKLKANGV